MYTTPAFQASRDNLQAILSDALKKLPLEQQSLWQVRHMQHHNSGGQSQNFSLQTDGPSFFLKINERAKLPLFRSQMHCLTKLLKKNALRCCRPFACGQFSEYAYLLLEHLDLQATGNWHLAGQQLARLHSSGVSDRYGFPHETFCGKSAQPNDWEDNWGHFFAVKRLVQQLMRFHQTFIRDAHITRTIDHIRQLLKDHQPTPALLLGDLSHEHLGFSDGTPIAHSPASYFGDREVDLAMSELCSRLPEAFYQGHESILPLHEGYSQRRPIYQLYQRLNLANHFAEKYCQPAEQALKELLVSR